MQPALFDPSPFRIGPAQPRPATSGKGYVPEYVQITPGVWAVCVYILIPKNGFGHLHFPAYWGAPQDAPRWRVDRHGTQAPDGTFIFTSHVEAHAVTVETFGPDLADIYRYMARIEIPSDDHRPQGRTTSHPPFCPGRN